MSDAEKVVKALRVIGPFMSAFVDFVESAEAMRRNLPDYDATAREHDYTLSRLAEVL